MGVGLVARDVDVLAQMQWAMISGDDTKCRRVLRPFARIDRDIRSAVSTMMCAGERGLAVGKKRACIFSPTPEPRAAEVAVVGGFGATRSVFRPRNFSHIPVEGVRGASIRSPEPSLGVPRR